MGGEGDAEPSGGEERRKYVAHDVYFRSLFLLRLAPDDRVIEHVVGLRVEVTVEVKRASGVEDKDLRMRQHRQEGTDDTCDVIKRCF